MQQYVDVAMDVARFPYIDVCKNNDCAVTCMRSCGPMDKTSDYSHRWSWIRGLNPKKSPRNPNNFTNK